MAISIAKIQKSDMVLSRNSKEANMHVYLFVLEVDPMEVGEIHGSLPLHCTLMPWFYTYPDWREILEKTRGVFLGQRAVGLFSGARAFFGEKNNTPVHMLVRHKELLLLHSKLLEVLSGYGTDHVIPRYVGQKFSPHVSDHKDRSFPPGSYLLSKHVYLIEAQNVIMRSNKKVQAKIRLE
ncbi:hypothetical protein A2671_00115 [Candidatus Kaiserbacteria bacterium RIFCSPHIGHO2_01_FULL_49_13]|uniref:2'-5' RNA ligase n=1 Tax=Candidatus Kaiserbacteria bacterium RIFCSPHIGHO2_01_FULL_49_13 TaxID=1798477 RepID=A0A1F6CDL9_9BACT|nr:MAG: hypothetical protein A2671_00115 [Candidatus Kaiserbacteria bacterium RIFCSPHIGHO2_01_FULL_49_13]